MTFHTQTRTLNVLVAGGAGFIGSHLCRALRSLNHRVVAFDNQITGSFDNLRDQASFIEFVDGDVTTELDLVGLGKFDVVVHLASPASPVAYARHPIETLRANSIGTENLLQLCARDKARFVYASTSEVYGDPLVHPQMETYFGNVNPIGPRAMYDESKRFGEMLVSQWREVYEVKAAIVRLFNIYGPGMALDDGRVVTEFITAALAGHDLIVHGSGNQTRSMTYITDLVSALLLVIGDPASDGLVLNIGSEEEVTVGALADLIISQTGSSSSVVPAPRRQDDPLMRRPDITRIRDRYRWQPTVPLEVGLRRTIEWVRSQSVRDVA